MYSCRYIIVKYVPDIIREEAINIGVILHSEATRYVNSRFVNNFDRVKKLAMINEKLIKNIVSDLEEYFSPENRLFAGPSLDVLADAAFLPKFTSVYANHIQFSQPRGSITKNFEEELDDLFNQFVSSGSKQKRVQTLTSRVLRSRVKRLFDTAKVLDRVEENVVGFGKFGDQIKIDFKYTNGKTNLLQVVSLDKADDEERIETSKVWAYNFRDVVPEIPEFKNAKKIFILATGEKQGKSVEVAKEILRNSCDWLINFDTEMTTLVDTIKTEAHVITLSRKRP